MKLDSQGSQFNPAASQRLKHVPDVLFVDEDGNPIEAGHENVIYVDENGNEIPEDIAQQLIESGKYVDSRDFYLDSNPASSSSAAAGAATSRSSAAGLGANDSQQATSYDLTQASLPASAFGSLSKSTGAHQMQQQSELIRKSANATGITNTTTGNTIMSGNGMMSAASSQAAFYQSKSQVELASDQPSTYDLLEAQAKIFAQAQAKMKQREEELALIEADANRESKLDDAAAASRQQIISNSRTKSTSNNDMQKSQSGRRLLQPPPLKTTATDSSSLKRQQSTQQVTSAASVASVVSTGTIPSSQEVKLAADGQQVFDLYQLINAAKQEQAAKQQQQQPQQQQQQSDEVRVRSRQGRSSRRSNRMLNQTQSTHDEYADPDADADGDVGEYTQYTQDETGDFVLHEDDVQSQLTEQHILEMREQQMLREKLLRKQQEYLEQQAYLRQQQQQQQYDPQDYDDEAATAALNQYEPAEQELVTDDEYYRQIGVSRNLTQSVGSTNIHTTNSSSSAAIVSNAQFAAAVASSASSQQDKLKEYLKDFRVERVKQVGSLSGKNVIYNLAKIDLSEFDRFYAAEEAATGSEDGNDDASRFIDPYDPNLFKDEIIDIDFGAIDAYTAGLKSQIETSSSAAAGGQSSSKLQFPSHVLTSNHATFIDNQLLLGDPGAFYQSGSSQPAAKSNVEFYTDEINQNTLNDSFGTFGDAAAAVAAATAAAADAVAAAGEYDDDEGGAAEAYSPSNSFGSMVDIQSQQTYSVGDIHNTTTSNSTSGTGAPNQNPQYSTTYYAQSQVTQQPEYSYNDINSTKMKQSLTNSAIYNVNNYISR